MFFVNPAIKCAKQFGFDQSSGKFITCGYRLRRYRRQRAFYADRTIYNPRLSGKRKQAGNERRHVLRRTAQTHAAAIKANATAIFPSHSTGNTCRGNGRIRINAATIFSLHPAGDACRGGAFSLTSRRLSAAGLRKRTDKHALACKKRRSGKRANSCRKRREHSVRTDKSTMFFERRQIKAATQTRKTAAGNTP